MGKIVMTSKCQFRIELEDSTSHAIVAGNRLRGRVVVKVDRGPPEHPATEIVLRLTGKEKAKILSGNNTFVAERLLCVKRTTLRREDEWSGNISPGTYVFPFSLPLPSTLPSSTTSSLHHHLLGSRSECEIVYKLKIDAAPRGQLTIRGAAQRVFSVASAPLLDIRVPASITPKFINVNSLGGIVNRGMIGITARVTDVQVGRGDVLDIFIATKNHASASIHRVQIDLVEMVVWKVKSKTESRTKTLATLPDVDLPGIIRGKIDTNVVREQMRRRIPLDEQALEFLQRELQSDQNRVWLRVPSHCKDSYGSNIGMIRITHELKITTYTRDLISNPSVVIPLQIGNRPSRVANSPPAGPLEERSQLSSATPTTDTRGVIAVPVSNHSHDGQSSMAGGGLRIPNLPSFESTDTPIAFTEAIAIPVGEDAIQYPEATAPPEAVVVGGMAPCEYTFTNNTEQEAQLEGNDCSSSNPLFCPDSVNTMQQSFATSINCDTSAVAPPTPSVEALLLEMLYSVDDYEIIRTKLQDSSAGTDTTSSNNHTLWKSVLAAITPGEFGSILQHVNRDTDQPSVAVLLATKAIEQGRFTCDYGRVAVSNSAEWNRQAMVTLILPHCVDARNNCGKIRDILSEWDKIITQEIFNYYTDESSF